MTLQELLTQQPKKEEVMDKNKLQTQNPKTKPRFAIASPLAARLKK